MQTAASSIDKTVWLCFNELGPLMPVRGTRAGSPLSAVQAMREARFTSYLKPMAISFLPNLFTCIQVNIFAHNGFGNPTVIDHDALFDY
jgi:hypothetical protein